MPKLLNLIDVKIVPFVKENKLILDISLDVCILFLDILLQLIFYSVFIMFVVFLHNALTRFHQWVEPICFYNHVGLTSRY